MAKKKNFWYVLVFTESGPVFVTKVNNADRTAEWVKTDKPIEFSDSWAKDLSMGLTWNGNLAYAICSPVTVDHQPYMYSNGKFEWVKKEKEG